MAIVREEAPAPAPARTAEPAQTGFFSRSA